MPPDAPAQLQKCRSVGAHVSVSVYGVFGHVLTVQEPSHRMSNGPSLISKRQVDGEVTC